MAEYLVHVLARLIVGYLTFIAILLAILAGYWIIEDYNAMVEFINSISDNTFAHIVVWMPFVFSWFKPAKNARTNAYYNRQANFWDMYDSTGGRW